MLYLKPTTMSVKCGTCSMKNVVKLVGSSLALGKEMHCCSDQFRTYDPSTNMNRFSKIPD